MLKIERLKLKMEFSLGDTNKFLASKIQKHRLSFQKKTFGEGETKRQEICTKLSRQENC